MKRAWMLLAIVCVMVVSSVSAVVIVPPLAYVASISLLTLLANMIVGFGVWLVVRGFLAHGFGHHSGSQWVDVVGKVSKAFMAGSLSSLTVIALIYPRVWTEVVLAALVCGILCFVQLAVWDFKRLRALALEARLQYFWRLAMHSVLFAVVFGVALYGAIEFTAVPLSDADASQSFLQESVDPLHLGIGIAQSALEQVSSSNESDVTLGPNDLRGMPAESNAMHTPQQRIWVQPHTQEGCVLETPQGLQTLSSPFSCVVFTPAGPVRSYCPIQVSITSDTRVRYSDDCRPIDGVSS